VFGTTGRTLSRNEGTAAAEAVIASLQPRKECTALCSDVQRDLDSVAPRLRAFARDCLTHGDMTPGAARMLNSIADLYDADAGVGLEDQEDREK